MKAIAQNEITELISDINIFADNADKTVSTAINEYNRQKAAITNNYRLSIANLERRFNAEGSAVEQKAREADREAAGILEEINKLDAKLSAVDKYYVKTKAKKEAFLSGEMSPKYRETTDYFASLEKIKKDFKVLYKKYSEDILPGLLNGLSYLFSSRRKKDYEELIVLKNTVSSFVLEIRQLLPSLTEESYAEMGEEFNAEKARLEGNYKIDLSSYEANSTAVFDSAAERLCEELDQIFPDALVSYLKQMTDNYTSNVYKVNTSGEIADETLNAFFIDYPVDFFVQSPIVSSVIKDKCSPMLVEGSIRFPMCMSQKDSPALLVMNDGSNSTAVQSLLHSIMFGFLSSCPVSKLVFRIADPENRGNSISPFFDAKKKLPELFGDKIAVTRDDVASCIGKLNGKIENILQEKLGSTYENVFDYAKDNPDYQLNVELLVLFDFPKGFDERCLADLRNVIRNGRRCGIYTVISYVPDPEYDMNREFGKNLQSIIELCTCIRQDNGSFSCKGLPVSYFNMPEKADFSKFFSKYMLIFEGIKNRGIAFSPLIKKLADAKDSAELESHISYITEMMRDYERSYGKVPPISAPFPSNISLGTVHYPSDIFSDSVGYDKIINAFKTGRGTDGDGASFVELPLTFDIRSSFNLFLNCPEETRGSIQAFTHHIIWSFLSSMPVTKLNVCVFDGEQRGNSVIPFLDFRKKSPDTFDQKIYTTAEAMTEKLRSINKKIDDVIQEKLGNKYRDIFDYNVNTPSRSEPVILLMIYDFPSGIDYTGIDLLTNILRNGNKCGIFTVICHNPSVAYSHYDSIDERIEQILKFCVSAEYKEGHYSLLPYNLQINVPSPVSPDDSDHFVSEYCKLSEEIKKKGLSFKDVISKDLFSGDSSKSLSIPIGVGDGDSIVNITFGEGSSHHGLIAGATGSGKSTLLHTLIMSGMLSYSPDQLHFYLMDFKSGTEFKIYETVKLPHIRLLALDAMQEFGESILENLVSEMERRGSLFKDAGQTSLKGYKEATGKMLPRILVVMDEFQILFNDSTNRKVAMNCAELTKRIVTEGRAFGIHLLMATQSTKVISDLTLSRGTIEQMRIRIGLKCGEDDARYLFSDRNDENALSMMKGPIGTAVMNPDYTEMSNVGFRTAYCDEKTQHELLKLIEKTYADTPSALQTFEGGRTTGLLEYFRSAGISGTDEFPAKIHIGTLIKVAPPLVISADRKKKHNMLICGANERMANMIANNYIISALLNSNTFVYCIDGDTLVGDDVSSDYYKVFVECAPDRFKLADNRGDIIRFISELYEKYLALKKRNGNQTVFVVIKNFQFLDIVQTMISGESIDESEYIDGESENDEELRGSDVFSDDSDFSFDSTSVGEKLLKLISDGSAYGINFVVTSLEYQPVKECMRYGENALTRFPERIIFSLGDNDADDLIENVSVAGLRENTVYYSDGVRNTFQMKPYTIPSPGEIRELLK